MAENTNTEREAFIRCHMQVMHSDEWMAAHVWDNDHLVAMLWRAGRASMSLPAAGQEPVAWMDDGTLRAGSTATAHRLVTAETKAGMPKAAAGSFTTPLYIAPPPQAVQEQREAWALQALVATGFVAQEKVDEALALFDGITKGGQHGPA